MNPEFRQKRITALASDIWITAMLFSMVVGPLLMGITTSWVSQIGLVLTIYGLGCLVLSMLAGILHPLIQLAQVLKETPAAKLAENPSKKNQERITTSNTPSTDPGLTATVESEVNRVFNEKAKDFLTKEEFMKDYLWKFVAFVVSLMAILRLT